MNAVKLPTYRQNSRLLECGPKEKLIIEPSEAMSKNKVSTKVIENKISQKNIDNRESTKSIENKDRETNLQSKLRSFSLRESKGEICKDVVIAEQEKNNEYSYQEADVKLSESIDDDEDTGGEDYEDDGNSTKETHAPLELMAEFLRAEMGHDYHLAKKLCEMILIYEPENPEAKEFFSVIEEMLQMEKTQSPEEGDEESEEDSSSESDEESSEDPSEESSDECEDD
ncbi:glutamate-rich protein 2 [Sorex araneus]|uniref:glutamate-rich protein 2 n=1 Tax=Sorex araneus TaxID=42254 RepID=UPI00243389FC|nr:glutamate-rich protein 2 [Sorex araneus]XP_054977754.1 glutamate-rich protein 2 [Sorex araneus]